MIYFRRLFKFVIMDFEFTMIDRVDLLLVSGAMSNSLDKYRPIKLIGRPLILTKDDKLRMFRKKDYRKLVATVSRIFHSKPDLLRPLLGQLETSVFYEGRSNLTAVKINEYLHYDKRVPIIVLWNGSTDFTIIKRLRLLNVRKVLDMTAYDDNNDNFYNLKIIDLTNNKRVLFSIEIGHLEKNGRMLNLMETHNLICKTKHDITVCHDPVTDVILTKCIFNFIMQKFKPAKFYRLCGRREL